MTSRIRMKTASLVLAGALVSACVPAAAASLSGSSFEFEDFDAAVSEMAERRADVGFDDADFEFKPEDLREKVGGSEDRDALLRRAAEDAEAFRSPASFDSEELEAARENLNAAFNEYLDVLTRRGNEIRKEVAEAEARVKRNSEKKFGKPSGSEASAGDGKKEKSSSKEGATEDSERKSGAGAGNEAPDEEKSEGRLGTAEAESEERKPEEKDAEGEVSEFETETVETEAESETEAETKPDDSVDYGEVIDAAEDSLLRRGIEYEIRWAVVDGTLYFVVSNGSADETLSVRCDGISVDGRRFSDMRLRTSVEPGKTAVAEFACEDGDAPEFAEDSVFKADVSVLLDAGDGDFTFEQFAATNAE